MSFLVGKRWLDAPAASFVRACALNFLPPGGFEAMMPAIVDYFRE
jgi:hypothetical protein